MSLNVNNAFLTGGAEGLGKGFTEVLLASGARVSWWTKLVNINLCNIVTFSPVRKLGS